MSSKRRRRISENSDANDEDDGGSAAAAAEAEEVSSIKSSGFSAFLQGLSKKRSTREVCQKEPEATVLYY